MTLEDLFEGHETRDSIVIRGVPDGSRIIVTSDQQIPFQDDALLDVIYGPFAKDFKPKAPGAEYHHFINGDLIDNYRLSRFPARALPKFNLGDEVNMAMERLARWRKPFTHNHLVYGNHEARWDKALYEGAGQLAKFTKPLDEALCLEKLGYDFVPYLKHYDFLGFVITHGDNTSKHAAAAMLNNYQSSGTSGHVNRPQDFTFRASSQGDPNTWYCTGMTCITNIGDVIKDWSRVMPWQQAFGYGTVENGVLHFQLARVHHGSFYAAGKVYKV